MTWNGLDTAGTEFFWGDRFLTGALEIIEDYEPVRRSDVDSPIYDDLRDAFPEKTWASDRPIFRRGNPLAKLGLIQGNAAETATSPLGKALLRGELTLPEVFQLTLKLFHENDGSRSFSEVARAAVLLPEHEFTLEHVEYALRPANGDYSRLEDRIAAVDRRGLKVPGADNRKRKLRSLMNMLVRADVLSETARGWILNDLSAAREVIGKALDEEIPLVDPIERDVDIEKRSFASSANQIEIAEGKRTRPKITAGDLMSIDPEARALMLEKAQSEHERIVEIAASDIRKSGGIPLEGTISYDVGCHAPVSMLLEAKHVHSANAISQLRKAVAQLPEYRWRHKEDFGVETVQIIALSSDPQPYMGSDYIDYLEQDRGMPVIWRDEDRLVDRHGKSLRDYLVPSS